MVRFAYEFDGAISSSLSQAWEVDSDAVKRGAADSILGQIGWSGGQALDTLRKSHGRKMAPEAFLPVALAARLLQTGYMTLHKLALTEQPGKMRYETEYLEARNRC